MISAIRSVYHASNFVKDKYIKASSVLRHNQYTQDEFNTIFKTVGTNLDTQIPEKDSDRLLHRSYEVSSIYKAKMTYQEWLQRKEIEDSASKVNTVV